MNNIAFDFDGVLADTDAFKKQWFLEKTDIFLKKANKTNIYKELSKYYEKNIIDYLYNEMSNEIFTKEILEQIKPVDVNIKKYLKKLNENKRLFIITKRPPEMISWIKEWLVSNELDIYFDKIISSSNTTKGKVAFDNNINILIDDDISNLKNTNVTHNLLFNSALLKDWNQLFDYIDKIDQRKVIAFFGLPGSGKSTFMEEFTDYTKITSSQLLIDNGFDVKSGKLINDIIVNKLMLEKIKCTDSNIILDGYPRTINQLNYLLENGITINNVYNIITPYDQILSRIGDRLTCVNCHESYTISDYKRPKITGICDCCGHEIVKRSDDEYSVYKTRIDSFIKKTLPLLNYYEVNKIPIVNVDGLNYEIIDSTKKICIGILWNTMHDNFDSAINELKKFGQIVNSFDINIGENLEKFIWDVYGTEPEMVRNHVKRKINYTVDLDESRIVRIIFLKTGENPTDIKKYIRNLYSNKISVYDYDNVFHLTENNNENVLILNALKSNIYNDSQILKNDVNIKIMKRIDIT